MCECVCLCIWYVCAYVGIAVWRDPFCGYWCLCRLERLVTRTGVTTSSNWSNQPFFHACFFENGVKEGMLTINYVAIRIRLIKIRALVELDSSAHTNYKIFLSSHLFLLKIPPSQHRGTSQQFSPCHPQHSSKEALDLFNILSVWTLIRSRFCTFMSIV